LWAVGLVVGLVAKVCCSFALCYGRSEFVLGLFCDCTGFVVVDYFLLSHYVGLGDQRS